MRNVLSVISTGLVVLVVACASSEAEIDDLAPATEPAPSPSLPAPEAQSGEKADAAPTGNLECPSKCVASDSCRTSTCDKTQGICVEQVKPDHYGCDKGECIGGECVPVPSCFGQYPQQFLHCDGASAWYRDLTTTLYPKSEGVTKYSCASGEIGTDIALEFDPPAGTNVTVKLNVTKGPDVDLDLIILEDVCMGAAACANGTIAGGGHAGVTPGTGTESVSFISLGKKYYVVIDGKVTTPTSFHVEVACTP